MARLASPGSGQRNLVGGVRAVQHPGDDAVFAFVDRHRGGLAAHGAVHGFDGHFAGERRGVGLPGGDFTLAGLAGGGGGVQRLAYGLEDGLDVQAQQRADAGGGGGAEVGDVVDLVLVQADGLDQVHLDLVAGGDGADQVGAVGAHVLGDGEDRRDVIARVGVVRGQERVVVVQFADGHAVGPGCPFRGDALADAEHQRRPCRPADGPWVSACARAATIGARFSEAMATEALSMIRLITMSVTSGSDLDGIGGDLWRSCGPAAPRGAGSLRSCRRGRGCS